MKILLSWLSEYLDCALADIDIERLVHLFNTRTAEIESYEKVTCDTANLFMGQVVKIGAQAEILCPELAQNVTLPARTDLIVDKFYLMIRDKSNWRWATLADFGCDKEGLMPALSVTSAESKGSWRAAIPAVDYVLEVDNKSINHRPDLWGHYGIAREVATFLDIPLKPIDQFLHKVKVDHVVAFSKFHKSGDWSVKLETEQACSRVAVLACNGVQNKDSIAWMAIRLARVGAKPMNAWVDQTNYVMFDLGHPMHVFDAQAFGKKEIVVRMARQGEKLELLDGQKIELNAQDVVIANEKDAVSLAGIMGGKDSGFQATTKDIILEAAGFDPGTIRRTAQRYKLRSEASMRFEKHLDPMQNITAIERFLFLAKQAAMIAKVDQPIVSVGQAIEPITCSLSHQFVQTKLGAIIQPEFIKKTLSKLGFNVSYDTKTELYTITVPTYRMTKDIKIQEDLVEEIIRSYGFENLDAQLPVRATQPFSTTVVRNVDHIKHHLAYGLQMYEVRDYLLYDEAFVQRLEINLDQAIRVKNPMSQNWTTLVTSLVPHLLKSVETNIVGRDHLRFFESNRIWHKSKDQLIEQKSIAGIIFDKKSVDFYQAKAALQSLFEMLKLEVVWSKAQKAPNYFDQNQVAQLHADGKLLGYAGMLSSMWMHKVVAGSAFVFELDGAMLEQYASAQVRFKAWSKFQDVCYDISLFVPLNVAVDTLKQAILKADSSIVSVELVDFFEKAEWNDQRSVTLRYVMSDATKTMTKPEIEKIVQHVQTVVAGYGAKIR